MSIPRIHYFLSILAFVVPACAESPAAPPESATAAPAESAVPAATPPAAAEPAAPPAEPTEAPAATPGASNEPAPATPATAATPASAAPKKEAHAAAHAGAEPAPTPAPTSDAPAEGDACQTKNFHYTQVASACRSGGRKAAKGVMKAAVKKAKDAGTDLKCLSCHEDMKDFHLKSNAVADMKKWL